MSADILCVRYLKTRTDDEWSMGELVHTLTNRRHLEPAVA
jgi:1,4-alpha-glucan branching enzyme